MSKFSKLPLVYFIVLCVGACALFSVKSSAQVQLAKVYNQKSAITISDYLVSEKYDGVRAIWTGEQLLTRQGNPISAPNWFTEPLPAVWLDGELWTQRQDFEALSGIVRTQTANDDRWRQVSYMVFDMPDAQLPFEQRYKNYTDLIEQINAEHIKAVKQLRFDSNQALDEHLQVVVENGAEGLMLHLASAHHRPGRNDALLKLKPYFDAEAEVVAHLPGRGKYTGMLGALRVRNQQGIEFSVGSGLSDAERANPPPIGSTITYKYHGYTNNGLPRFASFLRIRDDHHPEY
ncbi:DNA ligase [Nitrincola alkalisediminis]|uniref:DNA ligase n=1 Tax=Nitrincola alkalisediminis TaxID=1366656 RepID=UPI001875EB99|nr:DNA ligase [Nitrincola alkalisediminis]